MGRLSRAGLFAALLVAPVASAVWAQSLGDMMKRKLGELRKGAEERLKREFDTGSNWSPTPPAPAQRTSVAASPVPVPTPATAPAPVTGVGGASCVSAVLTQRGGEAEVAGVNGCGVDVRFDFCAVSAAMPEPVRHVVTLRAGQAWSVAFRTVPGAAPLMASNYCRVGESGPACTAVCPSPAALSRPRWTSTPAVDDFYPETARRQNLSGRVSLSCTVTETGRLSDCSVLDEAPAGAGFGPAAMRMTRGFRAAPAGYDGKPTANTRIEFPISFAVAP